MKKIFILEKQGEFGFITIGVTANKSVAVAWKKIGGFVSIKPVLTDKHLSLLLEEVA